MGCSDGRCKIPVPSWYRNNGSNGAVTGLCSSASLEQCNGVFASDTITVVPGGPVVTATFDVSQSNFTRFFPVALQCQVSAQFRNTAAGVAAADERRMEDGVAINALRFQGTNYLLSTNNLPIAVISIWAEKAMKCWELGELEPGGQDVFVDAISTVDPGMLPVPINLDVTFWLIGFSQRGGGGSVGSTVP